jgi:hypothetical protein
MTGEKIVPFAHYSNGRPELATVIRDSGPSDDQPEGR